MKIFKSWKKSLALLVAVLAALVFIPVMTHAAATFGPNRPTFDWNDPVHYPKYVTFNSFTNNPTWGDERYLIKGRDVNASNLSTNVPVTDGETVSLIVYFHNNAATDANKTALNTMVNIQIPSGEAGTQTVTGNISASNANPGSVFSTMDLTASTPFSLVYEPGSARLSNFHFPGSGTPLSDSVVNGGTLVGFDSLNGQVPGCSQFSGYVLIHVKVHFKPQPTPQYSCNLLNVTADSTTPRKYTADVTYTAKDGATFSSAKFDWGDNTTPTIVSGTQDSHTYAKDDSYTIVATLTFNVGGTMKTSSCSKDITVSTPAFACTALNVTTGTGRSVNASVTYSANNATFQSAKFTWGDNSTPTVVNGTSASHAYNADGSYTINATLTFDKGTTAVTQGCSKVVTFTPTQPPVVTPPPATPPTALPNTGPGSIAAIFAGVTGFAGMFHYLWNGRKQNDL